MHRLFTLSSFSWRDSTRARATWRFLWQVSGKVWAIPILIFLGLTATAAEGIGLGLLVFLLQLMLGTAGSAVAGGGILEKVYRIAFSLVGENVVIVASVTVGLIVMKSLLIAGYGCVSAAINSELNDRLRQLAFEQLMRADYSLVSSREHGHFQNLITSESLRASDGLSTVFQMLVSLCAIAAFGVMLLLISWQLVLLVLIGTLLASAATRLLVTRANRLGIIFSEAYSAMTSRVTTVLGGMRIVRAFGREREELAKFNSESDRVRRSFARVQYLKAATGPISEGLYLAIFVGIVALSTSTQMPLASVITFVVILGRLQPHVKNFDWCRVQLSGCWPAFERIAEFVETSVTTGKPSGSLQFRGLKQGIRFIDVSFLYPGAIAPALRNVSFHIPKGLTTAIVGGSGAGKSTVTNLLLQLYEPTQGAITADGISISDLELASWRQGLALAGQDADLMEGTILENVSYGCPSAEFASIERVAAEAGILDFIRSLPEGWHTKVGERGLRLSGGQRQRLSLARALLRRADLVILDEATNSLDSMLEAEIQGAVEQLKGETTIVIIAHRFSTVMSADNIVVLQNGTIDDQGAPSDLLARPDGLFGRLYAAQNVGPKIVTAKELSTTSGHAD
jgi:ATP-binding cassette, subfamily B, bacterial MsbA